MSNLFGRNIPGPRGKSAYMIALDKGFKGTIEQWLASLKGDEGDQGHDGYTPIKGIDYFDGSDGLGRDAPPLDVNAIGQSFASIGHTHSNLYQPMGDYLTTAMQSASSSVFVKSGFSTASISGTDIQGTANTDGVSLLIPKYLTTAATGGAGGGDWATSGITGSGISIITGASTNTLQYGGFLTTAAQSSHSHDYQSTGSYLTTAAQVSHDHGSVNMSATSNSTETAMRFTSGSSGWTIVQPSFITTAASSVHTHSDVYEPLGKTHSDLYPPIAGTTAYQTATLSNTFAQTGHTHSNLYEPLGKTHSDLYLPIGNSTQWATGTLSSALMPLAYSSGFQTGTLSGTFAQTANVMLTGERPNYFYTSNNTFLPQANSTQWATGTLSSALMPLGYSSQFQTATLSNTFQQVSASSAYQTATLSNTFQQVSASSAYQTATLAGTFMDKSYSSAFQTATLVNTFLSKAVIGVIVSNSTYTSGSVSFKNANGITFGSSGEGVVTASIGTLQGAISISAGVASANLNSVVFSNSNNHTFGLNGSTVTLSYSYPNAVTLSEWAPYDVTNVITNNSSLFGNSSVYFTPFDVPMPVYVDRINFYNSIAFTTSAASTITWTASVMAGIYTRAGGANSSVMSSIWSGEVYVGGSCAATSNSYIHPSGTAAGPVVNYSTYNAATANSSETAYGRDSISGARAWQIPIQSTMTPGHYWLGYGIKTTHGTGSASWNYRISYHHITGSHVAYVDWGQLSRATNYASANAPMAGFGSYRAQTAAMPSSVILNGSDIKFMTNIIIPAFNFSGYGTDASNI